MFKTVEILCFKKVFYLTAFGFVACSRFIFPVFMFVGEDWNCTALRSRLLHVKGM